MTANNWVYFVHDPDTDEIKIGQSVSPDDRLRALRRDRPNAYLLATMPDHSLERELHERFGHLHVGHEWHRAAPDLREYITAHKGRPDLEPIETDVPLLPPNIRKGKSAFTLVGGLLSLFGAGWGTAELVTGSVTPDFMFYSDLVAGYLFAFAFFASYVLAGSYIATEHERLARKAYFGILPDKDA